MDIQNAEYPAELPHRDTLVTALEFLQMVHANVPVKFTKTATPGWFKAIELWNSEGYLAEKLKDMSMAVAETPLGNADAPLDGRYFVQPYVRTMTGTQFFSSTQDHSTDKPVIRYMQSQDDNFPREFESIASDAPHSLDFADEALGKKPAAVNLWLGKHTETVSRLHNDNYENVYIQISGQKEVYLIPPGDAYALDERFLEPAQYDAHMELVVGGSDSSSANPNRKVLFPTVDPSDPETHNEIYRRHGLVYRVVLGEGDMLYLPALWYHQLAVASVGETTGVNVSMNYWYAPSDTSGLWMRWDYVRLTALVLRGYHDPTYFEQDEDVDDGEVV